MSNPLQSRLNRRQALRAAGTLLALPALESVGDPAVAAAASDVAAGPPKRVVFLGIGFGVTEETWFPDVKQTGVDYTLPLGLAPLARHKQDFTVVQGTCHKLVNDPHWGSTFWLTGANRFAEKGQSFHNTISVDQVAARAIGDNTRYTSIQLNGSEPELDGHGHGPGLSLAWDAGGKPIAGFNDPVTTFHRLFSEDSLPLAVRQAAIARNESVLDTVLDDARDLRRGLSRTDAGKLEEYFESIRDVETRLVKEKEWLGVKKPRASVGEPKEGAEGKREIQLMYDMIVAALQTDSTRVVTFRQPIKHLLKSLDVSVAAHDMSHYNPGVRIDASQKRDLAQSELLAGLIDKLKATLEPDGSRLFDHTTIVFGSNLHSKHSLLNCPTLIAGGGAGLKLGHHLVLPKNTPLCNVWLTMLRGLGVTVDRFGDSTGMVEELST
jgi:hypothetical protein